MKVLLFLMGVVFSSCKSPEHTLAEGWETLEGPNYIARYPSYWRVDSSGKLQTVFAILAPTESPTDEFAENVNFMTQNISGLGLGLESYAQFSVDQLDRVFANSTLIESKRIKDEPRDYYRVEYLGDVANRQLHFVQKYWVIEDTAFFLTLTCEATKFNEYQKVGEAILDSFKLKH